MPNLIKEFKNPSNEFRSMAFWVWNGDVSENRITEMLEQFKKVGIGGGFVHPRQGLVTEYLSERWFELWQHAVNESKRLGLECHIYDENSFPSGFGGGHVLSKKPYALAKYMVARKFNEKTVPKKSGNILKKIRLDNGCFLIIEQKVSTSKAWTAWFPSVDRTLPQTTQEFLSSTHQQYADRFSDEFGKTIKYAFADEPMLAENGGLLMSRFILKNFKRDHGYNLLHNLESIFVDVNDFHSIRFDYYLTLQNLWLNNFCKPIYDWCEKNNINFTGHFMEHEWPSPKSTPSAMASFEWMQSPGIDMLAFLVDFDSETANGLHLMNIKEVASVARQLGKERVLCEVHGGGGYNATPEDFKRMCDWILINGVNLVCEHLSLQTIAGTRKYDWAQTFSDHSPWFKFYKKQADHQARLSALLTKGKVRNRVLLLQPTTTAWLYYTPPVNKACDNYNSMKLNHFLNDKCEGIKESQIKLVSFLSEHQVDFDLGDEFIIKNHAKIENKKFRVGNCGYDLVIIPDAMENLLDSTLAILEDYLKSGGKVISVSNSIKFINGRKSCAAQNLTEKYKENWMFVNGKQELLTAIDKFCRLKIKCADGTPLPKNVSYENIIIDDESNIHFFINSGFEPVSFKVKLPNSGVKELDTLTGNISGYPSVENECGQTVEISLSPAGHLLLQESEQNTPVKGEEKFTEIKVDSFKSIKRTAPNVLPLHYCNLKVENEFFENIIVPQANIKCWQEHGFEDDIWCSAMQFKDNYSDFVFDEESGFEVEYFFQTDDSITDSVLNSLELAIEKPELFQVYLNGKSLSFENSERWFDENIKKVSIAKHVQKGVNSILLKAKPFNIHCEIAPVYLLGDFALFPVEKGFIMKNPVPLKPGDWTKQGLPFYNESVKYNSEFKLDTDTNQINISFSDWNGSAVNLEIDNKNHGAVLWPPFSFSLKGPFRKGVHSISFEVIGNIGNLMGPHFNDGYPIVWSWLNAPDNEPHGDEYKISPYGLEHSININIVK